MTTHPDGTVGIVRRRGPRRGWGSRRHAPPSNARRVRGRPDLDEVTVRLAPGALTTIDLEGIAP